ncbi:MAG: tRNA-guanine transglycosylase [Methanomicrobia archaeon]|nr:tRNA-guanine transglycosylase [Methanomicrobia archaeon]
MDCKIIKTAHGSIETPALLPVSAASYGVWDMWIEKKFPAPWDLAQGTVLSLYHILQYNRKDEIREKGIHRVLKTKKPIILDSGGFQFMKKNAELEEEFVLRYQEESGCDMGITFDYPILPGLSLEEKENRMERSIYNSNLALKLKNNKKMLLYSAVHGHNPADIKKYLKSLDSGFDGYAIGSLVPKKRDYNMLINVVSAARNEKPLHVFGITGFPALFALSYMGIETFDSWTYLVAAAFKEYIDPGTLKRVKLRKVKKLPECDCFICGDYDLNDFLEGTSEAEILLALHNLNVFLKEMECVREKIKENELESYILKKAEKNSSIKRAFLIAKQYI